MNKVYNKHHKNYPPDAVYIGRGSPYGNPFPIDANNSRDEVCDRFEKEILPNLDVSRLAGKDLICFCSPKRCHGDSILKKVQERPNCDGKSCEDCLGEICYYKK
jgi:hypothetical protein